MLSVMILKRTGESVFFQSKRITAYKNVMLKIGKKQQGL